MIDLLNDLLDARHAPDLAASSVRDLREHRDRLDEIESALSFGRRIAQGRLDIVVSEIEARATGATDPGGIVARLPEVLSRQAPSVSAAAPRPPRDLVLTPLAEDLAAALDRVVTTDELGDVTAVADDRLAAMAAAIADAERSISTRRSEVHRLIDAVQEEIIGRYRSGSTTVDELLADSVTPH